MSLAPPRRRASRLETWTIRSSVALAVMGLSFLAWAMADVDQDGLSSLQEMQGATSPFDADSDRDGAADGWETRRGGEKAASDPGFLGAVDQECIQLLKPCDGPPAAEEPEPPRTTTTQTTITTGVIGLMAAAAAVFAAAWASRLRP